jgi:two-component system NtrC family response regulator
LAHSGTLFLDEIGELSPNLQVKLLRVLQEKTFERVGGVRSVAVDIRVITATNRNLKDEMRAGRFREDLFYRLNVVHIVIPPLRFRWEDIQLLVDHFIKKYASSNQSAAPITGLSKEVIRLFYEYSWPGNIRELENVIERAIVLCEDGVIRITDLPNWFKASVFNTRLIDNIPTGAKLYETIELIEKEMIERALKMANNVQSHAAEILGITKSGLNQKIKRHNLEVGTKQ